MHTKLSERPKSIDVARRVVILKHVAGYALMAPPRAMLAWLAERNPDKRTKYDSAAVRAREKFWSGIDAVGLRDFFGLDELALAATTPVTMTHEQQASASWRIEALQALMWSLGMISQLPPYDEMANHDLLKVVPQADNALSFINSANLRDNSQIDRARNLAELWHWRSRTRQLLERGDKLQPDEKTLAAGFRSFDDIVRFSAIQAAKEKSIPQCINDDFPAKGKAYRDMSDKEWAEVRSITRERHFALNWLCGYAPENRWDETPTDT